jgi:hypothetical protein
MTYDHGEGVTPRGQGQTWGERNDPAAVDGSRRGEVWPQRPPHEPQPRTQRDGRATGGGTYGAPQGSQPPQGFQPPGQRPASLGDVPPRTAPQQGQRPPHVPQQRSAPQQEQQQRPPVVYGGGQPQQPQYDRPPAPPQRTFAAPEDPFLGDEPRSRKPLVFTLLLLLIIGAGAGWYFFAGPGVTPLTEGERRVADREADPKPLTEKEVFGAATIAGADGTYKVLKTQLSADCATAVGGDVVKELASAGCNQVVRATVTTPDGKLVITTGVFNLESRDKADDAADDIKDALDDGKGRFGGLVAGDASNIVSRAAANLVWQVRGHYLIYAAIAKADGSAIKENDSSTETVRKDLLESHLRDVVIHKRETGGS